MSHPKSGRVTVLMPMRNAGAFVADAIRSILAQSARDFTLLIIDDGSSDDSVAIAETLADERTIIVCDGRHLGVAARLNQGLDLAQTRFVARMDADDLSAPHRLARQLAFMAANPHVGVCGTWYRTLRAGAAPVKVRLPRDHARLRALCLFGNPFAHPSVMFNREHLNAAGLRYAPEATHAEDYDLWERASSKLVFANVPEFLLTYRSHDAQISTRHAADQQETANRVRRRALERLGIDPMPDELKLHCDYAYGHDMRRIERMKDAWHWLKSLEAFATRHNEPAIAAECALRARHMKRRIARRSLSAFPGQLTGMGRLFRKSG